MSNQIVKALEHGAQKLGKALAEDAGKAVKNFYRKTGNNLRKVAKNTREVDARHAEELAKLHRRENGGGAGHSLGDGGGRHAGGASGTGRPGNPQSPRLRDGASDPRKTAVPPSKRTCRSDPIDIASGEMLLQHEDVHLPGVLPLVLSRTHLSTYRYGGWFGPSWASTLDQRVELDGSGVVFASEDGLLLVYPVPTPGEPVLPVEGPRFPLEWAPEVGTEIRISDPVRGLTWHFDQLVSDNDGPRSHEESFRLPLRAITDRNGNRIDVEYSEQGVPIEVRHSGGYRIAVDSADSRITGLRLLDAAGEEPTDVRLAGFQYDGNRNLSGVVDGTDVPLRFTYDETGRITSWTDRNQRRYRYLYDRAGRCVQTRGDGGFLDAVFAYDTDRRTTTVRDSLGHATVYHLNDLGQVTSETDPVGGVVTSVWDRHDLLLSRTDELGRTTSYTYDLDGNLAAVTLADGAVTSVVHNDLHQPVQINEPDGSVWWYEYDERGNLLAVTDPSGAETRYVYGEFGQPSSITDAVGRTTVFETDAAGLLVSITDADGAVSTCARDAFGNPQTLTDPLGGVITCGWTVDGQPAWRTSPEGRTEWWKYDSEGNLLERIDETGATERFEYTFFDRVSARIAPDGARYEFEYDTELRMIAVTNPRGLQWTYQYDPAGRVVGERDFNGRDVKYEVDAAGELAARTNGAGQIVRYRRDALGRTLAQDAGGVVTTFFYDQVGRLLRTSKPGVEMSIDYDAAKRPVAETCNGLTLAHGYDRLGRRIARRTPNGAESSWSYGSHGRIEGLTAGQRSLRFAYDQAGREVSRDLGGLALHQVWDGADRLIEQYASATADGSPRILQRRIFEYRSDGCLTGISDSRGRSRSFSLDAAGRVTAVTGENWRESYAYDSSGNLAAADCPVSDPARSDTMGDRDYAGARLQRAGRVTYEYDGQGRLIRRSRRLLSGGNRAWQYEWDADDRLISLTTADGDIWRYLYDAFGRRVAKVRMTPDGAGVVEKTVFIWDGTVLAEQVHTDIRTGTVQVTTWDWDQEDHRVLTQTISLRDASQREVDRRFYAIVTDLVGTPTELIDEQGLIAWQYRTTLWGDGLHREGSADCPLRFPGQYLDRESGLHYNLYRYYDPQTGRYLSPDPLGLEPAPDPYAYVANPLVETDPLGLAKKPKCEVVIRYGSEAEAKQAMAANGGTGGLVPKFKPHDRQPKWIARADADLKAGNLGQPKHYTHKMEFRCKPGTYAWLKQWETKPTNEPGRYELPAGEIDRFNSRVEETTVSKVERGNAGSRRRR